MKIVIETIPHAHQRYDTIGDWYIDPYGTLRIKVSEDVQINETTGFSPDLNHFLVALHELVEAKLCEHRGITQKQTDDFDMHFESTIGKIHPDAEPGDHPRAPYRKEHRFAMLIEHMMAHELGMTGYGECK